MTALLLAGRYRLRDVLSSTAMAEVWSAVDTVLDRRIVVKLLAPDADRERFEREARAVAALAHPNIVELFDFGEQERPYMVFEHLEGGSLEEQLTERAAFSEDEVLRIASDVAAGLAHAHERGVVHRDLKPGNILFGAEGRLKIADFGIARVQGTDTLTDAGTVLGTAAYISPEQVRGEETTPATDVYSFGVILYRLLAGRLPFEAESPTELATLHRDAEPPPLVRGRLAPLVMAALAKDPVQRPSDGAALLDALDGSPAADTATTEIGPPPRSPVRRGSRRTLALALSAIFLTACGVAAAVLLTDRPASAPAGPPTRALHTSTTAASQSGPTSTSTASTSTSSPGRTAPLTTPTVRTVTTVTSPAPPPSIPVTTQPLTTTTAPTTTGP
jgi:serine/threonine protein kinase